MADQNEIEDLRRRLALAERKAAELEAVFESVGDAIYIGDARGITLTNSAGLEQLGFHAPADLDRSLSEIAADIQVRDAATGEPISPADQSFSRALAGLKSVREVLARHRLTGEDRILRSSAAPIVVDGRVVGAVAINTDVTDQKHAETALRESDARYRGLFESIDTGYCVIEVVFDDDDRPVDYIFRESNPAFVNQTGLVDAIGQRASGLMPDLEQFWFDTYGRIALTGQAERFEHRADPLGRWYNVYGFRVDAPDKRHVAVLFEDITERKQRELSAAFLDALGQDLEGLSGPDEIMHEAGARIGDFFGLTGSVFCDVDEPRKEVTIHYGWNRDDVPSLKQTFKLDNYVSEEFWRAGRAGENVIVADTAHDARVDRVAYAELKVGAFVVIPFFSGGRWTSYFGAIDTAPRAWQANEIALLEEVSERLFIRLERARAETALREREERQAFLLHFSDAIRGDATPDALAGHALRLIADRLGLDRCYVVAFDMAGDRADFPYQYARAGLDALPAGVRLSDFPASVRQVFDSTLVIDDADADPALDAVDRQSLASIGQRSFVAASLRSGERNPTAAIVAVSARPRRWTPNDISLIEDVAERTWTAIQRARAEAALRDSEEQQRLMIELVPALLWQANPTGTEVTVTEQWATYTGQSTADLSAFGWLDAIHPDDLPATRAAFDQAFTTGQPIERQQRIRKADDGYRWHLFRQVPVRDADSTITRWFGAAIDVEELRQLQDRQQILVAELQHRVRNILTVVRSVFGRTVEANSPIDEMVDHFRGRLDALARTQVVVTQNPTGRVDLQNLIREELLSVGVSDGPLLTIEGPDTALTPVAAESIGLAIHELTTNSIKYGALKIASASLAIQWRHDLVYGEPGLLVLTWTEQGVPAVPLTPARKGFGSELIEDALPYRLGGETKLEFRDGGIRCTLSVPLPDHGATPAPHKE